MSMRRDIVRVVNRFDSHNDTKLTQIYLFSERFARNTLERYAKVNRKWQDRTALARQGLKGSARRYGNYITMYLSHNVSYGKYLEKSNAGKYAILKPTMDRFKNEYFQKVKNIWR